MKEFSSAFAVIVLLQLPGVVHGSTWDSFQEVVGRYYFLDKQDIEGLSCQIEVPIINDFLNGLKNQLAPLDENIEFNSHLSDFRLTYSSNEGLKFIVPDFELELIKEDGVADPAKVKEGLEQEKARFQMYIDGSIHSIEGAFKNYHSPVESEYQNLEVRHEDSKIIVTYEQSGINISRTYDSNIEEARAEGRGRRDKLISVYEKLPNDKLAVEKVVGLLTDPTSSSTVEISFEYQYVEHVLFPKRIASNVERKTESKSQGPELVVDLVNCSL